MRLRRQISVAILSLGLGLGVLAAAPTAGANVPEAAPGTWTKVSTTGTGPSDRSVPAVAGVGNQLLAFGGVKDDFTTGQNTFYNDFYRLETGTGVWSPIVGLGPWPQARAFAAATADQPTSQFFVFGGSRYSADGTEFTAFDDLWSFAGNTWTKLPSGPSARSGATLWNASGKLYLFGGIDNTFSTLNDLWSFDLATKKWTEELSNGKDGNPPSRHVAQAGAVATQNKLTFYGGEGDPSAGFPVLNDTWQYDIAAGTWSDVTPAVGNLDPGRNYGAAGIVGNSLYLQGGDIPGGEAGCGAPFPQNPTEQLWRFDLALKKWEQFKPGGNPLVKLKRHAAGTVRGKVWVVNGWDFVCPGGTGPGQVWNTTVYSYTP